MMYEKLEIKRTTVDLPVKYIKELKEKGIPINKAAYYGIELILDRDKMINKVLNKIETHKQQILDLNKEIEFIKSSPDIKIPEIIYKVKKTTLSMHKACNITWNNIKNDTLPLQAKVNLFNQNAVEFDVDEKFIFDFVVKKYEKIRGGYEDESHHLNIYEMENVREVIEKYESQKGLVE